MIRTQRAFFDRPCARAFRRHLEREGARGWAVRRLCIGGALFLCAQARLAGDMSPFAAACFAAGLSAGLPVPAMLIGVTMGALLSATVAGSGVLMLPLGCVLIWALWKLLCSLMPRMRRTSAAADESIPSEDAWVAAFAALGALPAALVTDGASRAAAIVCALIAAPLAPTLVSALRISPARKSLMPDERLSLTLLFMLLVAGLHAVPLIGPPLGWLAAAEAALVVASLGASVGATVGLSLGLAIAATGGDGAMGAALGACAMAAGAVRALSRPAQAAAFVAGALVAGSYLKSGQLPDVSIIVPIAIASIGYCLIPQKELRHILILVDPRRRRRVDPQRLSDRLGGEARERVRDVGKVFRALAGGYAAPTKLPDEQALVQTMRARLCEGCAGYEGCWCGDEQRAARLMEKLMGDALTGLPALSAAELPPDVNRQCRRAAQIEKRLGPMLIEFADRRRSEQNRAECRGLMARQFTQAADLLHGLSARMARPVSLDADCAQLAAAALDREGLPAAEVLALKGERTEIVAVLGKGTWSASAARRAARRLSEETGLPLQPVLTVGEDTTEGELRFIEVPRLCVVTAISSRSHAPGQPSGDTAASRPLPGGRHMLALSDGMGSGAQAAAESAGAIALLTTFLTADVEKPLALESINGLMMLGAGDDMFATVDLCVIDMMVGTASFSKLGACASAVLRGREVIRVPGGRLPLGILEQVKPTQTTVALREGDRIVMVTDGVADPTRPGQQEWLDALLEGITATTPNLLSERILQAAALREGGPRDDMTVLVAQIDRADEKFW